MLIQYEYEILSFAALISTKKTDGNLSFLLSNLNKELDEDISVYISKLNARGFLDSKSERITIITKNWMEFFMKKLQVQFDTNDIKVKCEFDSSDDVIIFKLNGLNKKIKVIFNKEYSTKDRQEDCIYMCKIHQYEDTIYWLDLLNDINLLYLFFNYLSNQVSCLGKTSYPTIDNLEGLTSSQISEIFNVSIKNYFIKRGFNIIDLQEMDVKYIKKVLIEDNVSIYAISKNEINICVVKRKDNILFLGLRDSNIYCSEYIIEEVNLIRQKLNKKVSEYRGLVMYKENNVLDTTVKLTTQTVTYTAPIAMIISLLGLLNIQVSKLVQYKWILILAIIILAIIQIGIFVVIYLPGVKITRFKWDIK